MPDPKKKKTKKKTSTKVEVSNESIPMANRTINNMLRLEPESLHASSIESARANARSSTSIAPKDTVQVTGMTNSGEKYQLYSKRGSPNDIMQQEQGLLPNMFRAITYDKPTDDPSHISNYNYVKPEKKKTTRKASTSIRDRSSDFARLRESTKKFR